MHRRSRSVRSSGAGTICTVTTAERALFSRSDGSSRPRVTVCSTVVLAPATETGSVSASVARWTALSGPTTSTVAGSAVILPTTYPAAGLPSTGGHDRHLSRRRRLERQRDGRRRHLHHLDAERRRAPARASAETAAGPARALRRSSTATMSPAPTRLSAPDAPRTRTSTVRRHVAQQFEAGRKLLQLERHAQPALDRLLAGDDHPQQQRRGRATAPSARNGGTASAMTRLDSVTCTAPRAAARPRRVAAPAPAAAARSASASRPRSIWPSTTSEMLPVSSDTTIATASFSSVRPIAARWREPSSLLSFGLTVSGRKQAAAATRSSCTITAPSCSGDAGWKMLTQQIVGEHRVERNAALDVVAQADLPLDRDDRADRAAPTACSRRRRAPRSIPRRDSGLREVAEERRAAEMRQRAADVGLEQHDDGEHDVADQVANQPVDGLEVPPARAVEQRDEHAAAERHLHGARAANQLQHLVDQDRHHEDVGDIPPADRRAPQEAVSQVDHGVSAHGWSMSAVLCRISSATPTTCTISRDRVHAHDVRAAEHRRRHRGRRRPSRARRRAVAGAPPHERLARRPDEHRPIRAPPRTRAAAPAHHNCAPAVWQTRCPGRR